VKQILTLETINQEQLKVSPRRIITYKLMWNLQLLTKECACLCARMS